MSNKEQKHHDEEAPTMHIVRDEDEIEEENGEVLLTLDTNVKVDTDVSGLKLADDGRTVLIPKPTDDPNDPLNWTPFKKHMALLLIAFGSFAGDFGAAAGVPTIFVQAKQWHISPVVANRPNSLGTIMCGISGIIWMPMLNVWGRIPVLFWTAVLGLFFTLGAVLAKDFETHYAMRLLQCLTASTGQTIGLAFIKDCFFFHEHARKIGIWYFIYIASPFLSPMFGNFIVGKTGEWTTIFWVCFAWSAFLIVMILTFGDETYYNRAVPLDQQPERKNGYLNRLYRILGIWQIQHHEGYFATVASSYARLIAVFLKPTIILIMLAYAAIFMWFIGLNITSSILFGTPRALGGYGLSSVSIGYLFFTPVVALAIGEIFGHWFNDYLVRLYGRRHHGKCVPEVRLFTTYLGLFLMVPGLVLVGQTLQNRLSVVGIILGWGMEVTGVLVTSVAVIAYVLDCYPSASGEVSALINMARVSSAFSVGYFQSAWIEEQGPALTFGLQAVVVAVAFLVIVTVQVHGARLRLWGGHVRHLKF